MQINLFTTPKINLFRSTKKLLPYLAAGLLTIGMLCGCDRFEKQSQESQKQEIKEDKKGDTPISQEPPITNDTTYFNENGKKIREYDQDSCHVKCEYDSIGNPAKIEKVRMNKMIDAAKWYKSVTMYRGNGESTEIQTNYPKVNGNPVHPDSLKQKHELTDIYMSKEPGRRIIPHWYNPRRLILEGKYYEYQYK